MLVLNRIKSPSIICLRCGAKYEVRLGKDHRHFRSRMDAIIQNMFEINYSQLIQYEILEKLVTSIPSKGQEGTTPPPPAREARSPQSTMQ